MNRIDTTPCGIFVLRLALGTMFVSHGLLKILVFTVPGTIGFFESLGYPGWLAHVTIAAEIGGGVLLLLGFRTRLVSLALIPILLGAVQVHWTNGWTFSAPGGGWEYPAFLVAAAAAQALMGSGSLALDTVLADRRRPVEGVA